MHSISSTDTHTSASAESVGDVHRRELEDRNVATLGTAFRRPNGRKQLIYLCRQRKLEESFAMNPLIFDVVIGN
jgi:hypothetical protein